jgi:Family of unknown function (DUF5946)
LAGDDSLMRHRVCMWCRGSFIDVDGPTHDYMQSTPGCWAAFGRVLARTYEDRRYSAVHRLSVDSYAVQHPGVPSRQSIQSVGVHLVRLCCFIERGLTDEKANATMLAAARQKSTYYWLDPPPSLGPITVRDLDLAANFEEHCSVAQQWAKQMWDVWSPYHGVIRSWVDASR